MLRTMALFAAAAALPLAADAVVAGTQRLHVRFDTSAWTHRPALLAVDVTGASTDCPPAGEKRTRAPITFRDIVHDGSVGPLRTEGCGGMQGSLILHPRAPAIWIVPRGNEQGFAINFANREFMPDPVGLGSYVRFTIELPDDELEAGEVVAFGLLDAKGGRLFGDAAGRLVTLEADPAKRRWRVRTDAPARRLGDTITVVLPKPAGAAKAPAWLPHGQARIVRVDGNLSGGLWVEYAVPLPGGPVRVIVSDSAGVERYRWESVITSPGVYGNDFPDDRRTPAQPGRYRIVVEIGGQRFERDYELRPPAQR